MDNLSFSGLFGLMNKPTIMPVNSSPGQVVSPGQRKTIAILDDGDMYNADISEDSSTSLEYPSYSEEENEHNDLDYYHASDVTKEQDSNEFLHDNCAVNHNSNPKMVESYMNENVMRCYQLGHNERVSGRVIMSSFMSNNINCAQQNNVGVKKFQNNMLSSRSTVSTTHVKGLSQNENYSIQNLYYEISSENCNRNYQVPSLEDGCLPNNNYCQPNENKHHQNSEGTHIARNMIPEQLNYFSGDQQSYSNITERQVQEIHNSNMAQSNDQLQQEIIHFMLNSQIPFSHEEVVQSTQSMHIEVSPNVTKRVENAAQLILEQQDNLCDSATTEMDDQEQIVLHNNLSQEMLRNISHEMQDDFSEETVSSISAEIELQDQTVLDEMSEQLQSQSISTDISEEMNHRSGIPEHNAVCASSIEQSQTNESAEYTHSNVSDEDLQNSPNNEEVISDISNIASPNNQSGRSSEGSSTTMPVSSTPEYVDPLPFKQLRSLEKSLSGDRPKQRPTAKPYRCPYCDIKFAHNSSAIRHLQHKHGVELDSPRSDTEQSLNHQLSNKSGESSVNTSYEQQDRTFNESSYSKSELSMSSQQELSDIQPNNNQDNVKQNLSKQFLHSPLHEDTSNDYYKNSENGLTCFAARPLRLSINRDFLESVANRHLRSIEKPSGIKHRPSVKPYHCPVCPVRFAYNSSAIRHLQHKHGVELDSPRSDTEHSLNHQLSNKSGESSVNASYEQQDRTLNESSYSKSELSMSSQQEISDIQPNNNQDNVKNKISKQFLHSQLHEDTSNDCYSENGLNCLAARPIQLSINRDSLESVPNRHLRSIEKPSGIKYRPSVKPYQCPLCPVRFAHNSSAIRHIKYKHVIDLDCNTTDTDSEMSQDCTQQNQHHDMSGLSNITKQNENFNNMIIDTEAKCSTDNSQTDTSVDSQIDNDISDRQATNSLQDVTDNFSDQQTTTSLSYNEQMEQNQDSMDFVITKQLRSLEKFTREDRMNRNRAKPYQCPYCEVRFAHNSSAIRHLKQKHSVALDDSKTDAEFSSNCDVSYSQSEVSVNSQLDTSEELTDKSLQRVNSNGSDNRIVSISNILNPLSEQAAVLSNNTQNVSTLQNYSLKNLQINQNYQDPSFTNMTIQDRYQQQRVNNIQQVSGHQGNLMEPMNGHSVSGQDGISVTGMNPVQNEEYGNYLQNTHFEQRIHPQSSLNKYIGIVPDSQETDSQKSESELSIDTSDMTSTDTSQHQSGEDTSVEHMPVPVMNQRKERISPEVKVLPKIVNTYKCPYCDLSFATKSRRSNHEKDQHPSRTKVPKARTKICDECGVACASPTQLTRHKLTVHQKLALVDKKVEGSLVCPICKVEYSTDYYIKRHRFYHAGKKFPCTECDEVFHHRQNLSRHKKSVHEDHTKYKVKCEVENCLMTFKTKVCLNRHIDVKHTAETVKQGYMEQALTCDKDDCSKVFDSVKALQIHIKLTHSYKKKKYERVVMRCNLCGMKAYNDKMKAHLDFHAGFRHGCEDCGLSFEYRRKLQRHRKYHGAPKENRSYCHDCTLNFSFPYQLAKHMKDIHKVIIVFSTTGEMIINKKVQPSQDSDTSVSKENIVSCSTCLLSFISQAQLEKHMGKKHQQQENTDLVKSVRTPSKHPTKMIKSNQKKAVINTTYARVLYNMIAKSDDGSQKCPDVGGGFSLQCQFCKCFFRSKILLRRHVVNKHVDEISFGMEEVTCKKGVETNVDNVAHASSNVTQGHSTGNHHIVNQLNQQSNINSKPSLQLNSQAYNSMKVNNTQTFNSNLLNRNPTHLDAAHIQPANQHIEEANKNGMRDTSNHHVGTYGKNLNNMCAPIPERSVQDQRFNAENQHTVNFANCGNIVTPRNSNALCKSDNVEKCPFCDSCFKKAAVLKKHIAMHLKKQ